MIYLEQDSTNLICLSKSISSDVTFTSATLNLIGILDAVEINNIVLTSINAGSTRFDLFTIILTGATSQNLNNGILHINTNGQYTYNYYNNGQIVETGICKVYTNVTSTYEFTNNNNTQYFSYNNE